MSRLCQPLLLSDKSWPWIFEVLSLKMIRRVKMFVRKTIKEESFLHVRVRLKAFLLPESGFFHWNRYLCNSSNHRRSLTDNSALPQGGRSAHVSGFTSSFSIWVLVSQAGVCAWIISTRQDGAKQLPFVQSCCIFAQCSHCTAAVTLLFGLFLDFFYCFFLFLHLNEQSIYKKKKNLLCFLFHLFSGIASCE